MNQLPGRQPPRWLRIVVTVVTTTVMTIWLLSLLPFLLLFALVFGILLIPVLRRLGDEMNRVNDAEGIHQSPDVRSVYQRSPVDVTPWNRQVVLFLTQLRNRSSAMRR